MFAAPSPASTLKLSALAMLAVAALGLTAGCAATPSEDGPTAETTASALETKDHSKITGASCRANKLPEAFCARMESEAFNVDHNEWTDLSAHSQTEFGQSTCDAAAAVQTRLHDLGGDVRTILSNADSSPSTANNLARALGRAMHTIQDNCAHSGMTNEQHAWLDDREICITDGANPDIKPEALACAREESAAVMSAFKDALVAAKVNPESLSAATQIVTNNPSRDQACGFIRGWKKWDGVDGRWDNVKTRHAFRETIVTAFTKDRTPKDLCAGGASIASPDRDEKVEVTDPWCPGLSIFCVGE
jgi:hypothetical protein